MHTSPTTVTTADLQAAGLYDPGAGHAAERLALLQFLLGLGASIEDLVESREELPILASVLALRVGRERLTLQEAADRSGVPPELLGRIWRAAGFAEPAADARFFSDVDVELMSALRGVESIMGIDSTLQLIRVMGAAMARVADAMVSAFLVHVAAPTAARDPEGLALAQANAEAVALLPEAARFFDVLLRRHIEAARRPLVAMEPGARYETQHLSVGFVDLVGSTALAQSLPMSELGAAISDFETMSLDVVTGQAGRLVKLIGDEAMFVAPDAVHACEIALGLAQQVTTHPVLPPVRVGVAVGDVLIRDGDYFGPVVNLAARSTKKAAPGAVVVSANVRAAVERGRPGAYQFEELAGQELRGFETPVDLYAVTRSAPADA